MLDLAVILCFGVIVLSPTVVAWITQEDRSHSPLRPSRRGKAIFERRSVRPVAEPAGSRVRSTRTVVLTRTSGLVKVRHRRP